MTRTQSNCNSAQREAELEAETWALRRLPPFLGGYPVSTASKGAPLFLLCLNPSGAPSFLNFPFFSSAAADSEGSELALSFSGMKY